MTTTRPYRKALDVQEALRRLGDAAGSQLDETLVAAFIDGIETADDAPDPRIPVRSGPVDAAGRLTVRAISCALRGPGPRHPARLAPPGRHARGAALDVHGITARGLGRRAAHGDAERENIGGNGGGDEITCVQVDVPSSFAVSGVAIVSVKGQTSPAVHRWQATTGSVGGVTRATFKNPTDDNPLVGLPAGDAAVFRITGTASGAGLLTLTGHAFDKPGRAATNLRVRGLPRRSGSR
jgi:hypothetical protein